MQYVCDAPDHKTWFRLETQAEAVAEAEGMRHAVDKYYRREQERATQSFCPASNTFIEQNIGLTAHILREMPLFLTLRDAEGDPLITAMLPRGGRDDPGFRIIIVGRANSDPYPQYARAIEALGNHFRLTLERDRCYPYERAV